MFTKIIVPLDGSSLAEQALPTAISLTKALNARLVLIQVKPIFSQPLTSEQELRLAAEDYLQKVLLTLTAPYLDRYLPAERIDTLVEIGLPETEIGLAVSSNSAGLAVMATHSRSALLQLIKGSTALKVLRLANVPLVLIHPAAETKTQPLNKTLSEPSNPEGEGNHFRMVVTLDGSDQAEVALEPAYRLARQLGAMLYLIRVVQPIIPAEYLLYRANQNYLKEASVSRRYSKQLQAAEQYLKEVQIEMLYRGVRCVKAVLWGDPSSEIKLYAQEVGACLLVMATHTRGRFGEFLLGSVAQEVVSESHLPILMVPIGLPKQRRSVIGVGLG